MIYSNHITKRTDFIKLVIVYESYVSDDLIARYLSKSDLQELTRIPLIKQKTWILGRIALKQSCDNTSFVNLKIMYNQYGQPKILSKPSFSCSISHSQGIAIASSAQFDIGVDVEAICPRNSDMLEYIADKAETDLVNIENQDQLITTIYVIKEAVLKALGLGIGEGQQNFAIVRISQKLGNEYIISTPEAEWQVMVYYKDNYVIGIASPHTGQKMQYKFITLQ